LLRRGRWIDLFMGPWAGFKLVWLPATEVISFDCPTYAPEVS
jgi:hypothetical protein